MSETLLPCPFCGGEAHTYKNNLWHVACENANARCVTMSAFVTEAEAIEAWNTRATGGTLTAEQVREVVMSADRWGKPMGNTGLTNTHLIIRDDGWQAIADELNAALGAGECETCHGESDLSEWVCSECQCWIPLGLTPENIGRASEWRYCPHCGREVKAVKR